MFEALNVDGRICYRETSNENVNWFQLAQDREIEVDSVGLCWKTVPWLRRLVAGL